MRIFLYSLLSLSLLVACKSRKKHMDTVKHYLDSVSFVLNQNGKDSLLRQEWEYLSTRVAVDYYSSEEDQSFSLNIRMRRDSLIWFTVSAALNFQVMKGIITRDSVKALDLINKKYYAYGISSLGNRLGAQIGLRDLQNLLSANPVYDTLTYTHDSVGGNWVAVNPPVTNVIYSKDFSLPDSSFLAQKGTERQLKTLYSGTLSAGKITLAQFMDLYAMSASKTIRMQMEFKNASDAYIPLFPFTVPEGYDLVKEE